MPKKLTPLAASAFDCIWAESHEKRIAGAWIVSRRPAALGAFGSSAGFCPKRTKTHELGPESTWKRGLIFRRLWGGCVGLGSTRSGRKTTELGPDTHGIAQVDFVVFCCNFVLRPKRTKTHELGPESIGKFQIVTGGVGQCLFIVCKRKVVEKPPSWASIQMGSAR